MKTFILFAAMDVLFILLYLMAYIWRVFARFFNRQDGLK
jgi:hypothetical protein